MPRWCADSWQRQSSSLLVVRHQRRGRHAVQHDRRRHAHERGSDKALRQASGDPVLQHEKQVEQRADAADAEPRHQAPLAAWQGRSATSMQLPSTAIKRQPRYHASVLRVVPSAAAPDQLAASSPQAPAECAPGRSPTCWPAPRRTPHHMAGLCARARRPWPSPGTHSLQDCLCPGSAWIGRLLTCRSDTPSHSLQLQANSWPNDRSGRTGLLPASGCSTVRI